MLKRPLVVICLGLLGIVLAEMEGKVVDGTSVDISEAPHSVFLDITCPTPHEYAWVCGASVINQYFALTAAHCVFECDQYGVISVAVGHAHNERGSISSATKYKVHEDYYDTTLYPDIGLVLLKTPFKLGSKIKRTVIMSRFPHNTVAYISGWGMVDETEELTEPWLHQAKQKIYDRAYCLKILDNLPEGNFCAGSIKGYAARGDSGSALVVKGYIQIGIVSYKKPHTSRTVIAYVNVTRYYKWIRQSTASVFCGRK